MANSSFFLTFFLSFLFLYFFISLFLYFFISLFLYFFFFPFLSLISQILYSFPFLLASRPFPSLPSTSESHRRNTYVLSSRRTTISFHLSIYSLYYNNNGIDKSIYSINTIRQLFHFLLSFSVVLSFSSLSSLIFTCRLYVQQ